MKQLDADFTHFIDKNIYNMFAFFEGLPINDKQVSLTSNCTKTFILLLRLLVYKTFSNY
jgi:hypothetical protein